MKPNNKKPSEAARFLDNLESILTSADPVGEELAESLRDDGLDPNRVDHDLRQLLEQHAPTWKQKAERERKSALEALSKSKMIAARTRAEVEQGIREIVQAMRQLGAPVIPGHTIRSSRSPQMPIWNRCWKTLRHSTGP